jgi:sugar transferase (PEP-CTERM/EpsH1 system associated)
MNELLFLSHRIPYPPDKGDKIRSWNFLRHLAERRHVHLGCFIDDERDWAFTDTLRRLCGECCFVRLDRRRARLRALRGLLDGRALTLPYYDDGRLHRWVRGILARPGLDQILVYCSAMAPYVPIEKRRSLRCVADIVDVDSEKWSEYAQAAGGLKAWLWRREGAKLRRVESEIAATFDAALVATAAERDLLTRIAPESASTITDVANGVDSDYFSPERPYERPAGMDGTPLVFTGAMDYRPNADAALHFAREVLPAVRARLGDARFFVVGANPTPAVHALSDGETIIVTGRVPDVRPYINHARAVVAPLQIARGVQNKVLEGMAMARPVVASPQALVGIAAEIGAEILAADTPAAFADAIARAVRPETGEAIGRRARQRVVADYSWSASLTRLDAILDA